MPVEKDGSYFSLFLCVLKCDHVSFIPEPMAVNGAARFSPEPSPAFFITAAAVNVFLKLAEHQRQPGNIVL